MPGGEQKTTSTQQFSPQREDFLGQIFGTPGGLSGMFGGGGGETPGVGLGGLEQLFGQGAFGPQGLPMNALADLSRNGISQLLGQQSPEMQAFNLALGPLQGILSGQQNLEGAISPVFQRNLAEAQAQLSAGAPGRFSSAFLQQGTDIAGRALQDFNLFASQLAQQQQANQLQAGGVLAQLAQSAGQGPFQRLLQTGQLGLDQQQAALQPQQFRSAQQNQAIMAILQMLNTPQGQTQTTSGGGGLFGTLGGLLGFGAGAFGGPFLGQLGSRAGGGS